MFPNRPPVAGDLARVAPPAGSHPLPSPSGSWSRRRLPPPQADGSAQPPPHPGRPGGPGADLQEHGADERINGGGGGGAPHALEAPEDEPALTEDGEEVEHGGGGAGPGSPHTSHCPLRFRFRRFRRLFHWLGGRERAGGRQTNGGRGACEGAW